MQPLSERVQQVLRCSACGQPLEYKGDTALCCGCGIQYDRSHSGILDLRLRNAKPVCVQFLVGEEPVANDGVSFRPLTLNPLPQIDVSRVRVPKHLTREIVSYFPRATTPGSLMLDLGCGTGVHREVCEYAGYEWVGLDYDASEALLLGDGHALPLANDSFEFVLSIAVLEHIRYPFVMMREVFRVLEPGGVLIGTVAFLEPFHGDCYYHHTHMGTHNVLRHAGFEVLAVAPHANWNVLVAQATMSLFPYLPRPIAELIVWPVDILHRLWWRIGRFFSPRATEQHRLLFTSGAFTFIARKPVTP
jgi:SAM-dependent methyltransferase